MRKWERGNIIQGARKRWCQRFSACMALKVAPQRGEGEKREGLQISKNSTQNLWHHLFLAPCTYCMYSCGVHPWAKGSVHILWGKGEKRYFKILLWVGSRRSLYQAVYHKLCQNTKKCSLPFWAQFGTLISQNDSESRFLRKSRCAAFRSLFQGCTKITVL